MNVNETAMPLKRSFTTLHFAARLSLKLCKYSEMERLSGRMGTPFHPRKEVSRRRRWRDESQFSKAAALRQVFRLSQAIRKTNEAQRTGEEYELHESAVAFYVCDTHHSLAAGPAYAIAPWPSIAWGTSHVAKRSFSSAHSRLTGSPSAQKLKYVCLAGYMSGSRQSLECTPSVCV